MYNNQPIFLQPVFQERVWGGIKLHTEFDYHLPTESIGEAWVISAHPNGPSIIENGPLKGKTLMDAWMGHGELFNRKEDNKEEYPLLVKLLDAADDLSVQVHPNDEFARDIEGVPYGKTECWYVLSAEEGAEIVLGHRAPTKEKLAHMIDNGQWETLLRRVKVKAGDFIYVASGTIHAIGKGILLLETQQSSDVTYRVYDYDRMDASGEKRALHLEESKEVTTVPDSGASFSNEQHEENRNDGLIEKKLVEAPYFTVYHWMLDGTVKRKMTHDFLQVSVVEGRGEITIEGEKFLFKKGSHFIIPFVIKDYTLKGVAEFIVSHV
ncbi:MULTISPECIES: mannose-6-phosphate isomerase, class I [unclassified Sutcliffiella]|uniref:mannose-6-phosphate isomerase, class I n=1 Tax=unclassified Sutcliffiella TaxID=2837532 RepID=UPI0030CC835E